MFAHLWTAIRRYARNEIMFTTAVRYAFTGHYR